RSGLRFGVSSPTARISASNAAGDARPLATSSALSGDRLRLGRGDESPVLRRSPSRWGDDRRRRVSAAPRRPERPALGLGALLGLRGTAVGRGGVGRDQVTSTAPRLWRAAAARPGSHAAAELRLLLHAGPVSRRYPSRGAPETDVEVEDRRPAPGL